MRSKDKVYEELLVASSRLGDRKSLEALIRFRSPKLFSHACRLIGNRDEAGDIVQEAWLEIIQGLPGLRNPRAFSTWAYRIVSRRCAKTIARNIKHRKLAVREAETPLHVLPIASEMRTIRAAIDQLPVGQAAAIRLFYLEDFSIAEVGIALDIPAGTVKTRLMHARKSLKSTMKGD